MQAINQEKGGPPGYGQFDSHFLAPDFTRNGVTAPKDRIASAIKLIMRRKKVSPPNQLQNALDWLAEPQPADPPCDLNPLRKHITAIVPLGLSILHHLKINELQQQRADRIDQTLPGALGAKQEQQPC